MSDHPGPGAATFAARGGDGGAADGEGEVEVSAEDAVALEIRRRRLAAGWSQSQLAKRSGFDRQYISRAENSTHGLPSENLVAILDTVLEAGGALVELRVVAAAERRDRREGVLLGPGEARVRYRGVAPPESLHGQVDHPLVDARRSSGSGRADLVDMVGDGDLVDLTPTRVGWPEVEQVRAVAPAPGRPGELVGGGGGGVTAPAALRWATGLLSARATARVGAALFEAVGNLAGVVGFVAFDVGDNARARRLSSAALWCAERGGSWALRGAVLADVARQHFGRGELDDAQSAVEFALVRDDRLSATACAAIGVVRAQVLAALGRFDDARAAVERADAQFACREPEPEPPWLSYYDAAEHAGSTAKALVPLDVQAGRPGIAAQRFAISVVARPAAYPRSRALSAVRLADLQMRVGDPQEAVASGRAALDGAVGITSGRLDTELRRLARTCHDHPRIPDAVELAADLLRR